MQHASFKAGNVQAVPPVQRGMRARRPAARTVEPAILLLVWFVAGFALPNNAQSQVLPDVSQVYASAGGGAVASLGQVEARRLYVPEAGKQVRHLVYAPSAYLVTDEERRWPLIVGLHGTAGRPEQVMDFPRMQEFAERFGYLVVCPFSSGVGDLAQRYVLDVVADTKRHFRVDPEKIFLLGFSRGGAGVWSLGSRHPELWAGLVPISPATPGDPAPLDAMRDLPIFVVIGDQDKAVSLRSVRRWARRMEELEMVHELVELPGMGHDLSQVQFLPLVFAFLERSGLARSHSLRGSLSGSWEM